MPLPSHYRTLRISTEASSDDIRDAYRKPAKKFHPDTNQGDLGFEEKFKKVAAAYSALSDPNARQLYDKLHVVRKRRAPDKRTKTKRAPRPSPKNKFTQQQPRQHSPVEGRNVKVKIFLTLEEAVKGGIKQIRFQRDTTCGYCEGLGRISTPPDTCKSCEGTGIIVLENEVGVTFAPGVRQGDEVRMLKAGHMGTTKSAGDLIAAIIIKSHKYLKIQHSDLHYHYMLGIDKYIEGGKIKVPAPTGIIEVNLPLRFPDHGSLRLPGRGLPACQGRPAGDLVINVEHCLPRKLSKKERSIVQELMEMTGFNPPTDKDGLFPKGDE